MVRKGCARTESRSGCTDLAVSRGRLARRRRAGHCCRRPRRRRMRIVEPAEAVAGIRSGQQVFLHGGAATPSVLLDALVARADELADVKMLHLHCEGPGPHLLQAM